MISKSLQRWKAKGQYFDYKGHKIFYVKEGKGPVLLMMHGYPLSTYDWRDIWDALKEKYLLIAPDMLGMGFSDKPKNYNYSCHDHADMHTEFLSHLVRQELSKCIYRQSYFSSDQGGKTGIMPKHNEDFSNDEQEEKNKYKCASISFLTH